jgi:hypothetical protein
MTPPEPDPTTEQLRAVFAERAESEAERADDAEQPAEERTHARRADKAEYLKDKLREQSEADRDG